MSPTNELAAPTGLTLRRVAIDCSTILRRLGLGRPGLGVGEEVLAAGDVAECLRAAHGEGVGGAVEEELVGDVADGGFEVFGVGSVEESVG